MARMTNAPEPQVMIAQLVVNNILTQCGNPSVSMTRHHFVGARGTNVLLDMTAVV